MGAALRIGKRDTPAALAASGRFGLFKSESEQTVRIANVETNPIIEEMRRAWGECIVTEGNAGEEAYFGMLMKMEERGYSAKDIEAFSIVLGEFQGQNGFSVKAGSLLSVLINSSRDDEFIIHTAHITEPVDVLGYRNTKSIIVEGNAGACLGREMEGGIILVKGNVENSAGYRMEGGLIIVEGDAEGSAGLEMKGGEIRVKGNASVCTGFDMRGGVITVEGDAGGWVGEEMKGGEIHVDGGYQSLSKTIIRGKIFYKGKLIAGK